MSKHDVTNGDPGACTCACTGEAEKANKTAAEGTAQANGDGGGKPPLEALAQAIANLSANDRAKLAAMLAEDAAEASDSGA